MALMNYATVFASAGFAGESFDICQGYNLSFTAASGDATFDETGGVYTITLSAGTWPTWIREVGKVFTISGTTLNNGTFTVVSVDGTFKILTVLETIVDEAAQTPVVDGSADTRLISNLLEAGNGVLTTDAPLVLTSTGALGAARTLNIAALEVENAAQGAEALNGRFFYLSVQNTDISSVNKITVSATTSINGAATFEIVNTGDYLFFHVSGGVWRVNVLPRANEGVATLRRVPFTAADWSAGTVNEITIIPSGTPVAGEVGPHDLTVYPSYMVQVINTDLTPDELVDVEVQFDASGNITLVKAQKAKPFNGVALIASTID